MRRQPREIDSAMTGDILYAHHNLNKVVDLYKVCWLFFPPPRICKRWAIPGMARAGCSSVTRFVNAQGQRFRFSACDVVLDAQFSYHVTAHQAYDVVPLYAQRLCKSTERLFRVSRIACTSFLPTPSDLIFMHQGKEGFREYSPRGKMLRGCILHTLLT